MNKEDCTVGQRVKITPKFQHTRRFEGLIGTIKELPPGYIVVEISIPLLEDEIECWHHQHELVRPRGEVNV